MIPRTFSEEMMIVGPRFNRKPAEILEYWNRGALELYGWTVEEALGSVVYDLLKTVFSVSLEQIEEDVVQRTASHSVGLPEI